MKLKSFIQKNKIKLSPTALKLCFKAEKLLRKSIDPVHDINHVENMLNNLNYLLMKNREIKKKIDMDVMLLSLFWHDVWVSRQRVFGFIGLMKNQLIEGMQSARIFWTNALKKKMDKNKALNVYYAIRKHSSFQIFPLTTLEAKILTDLDKLELWNNVRLLKNRKIYVGRKEFYQKYLVRFYYFYSYKMGLYFAILNRKFDTYAKNFWKENGLI